MSHSRSSAEWRTELLRGVMEAIASLRESRGSNITAIVSYIRNHTRIRIPGKSLTVHVRKVLKDAVEDGTLNFDSGRYSLEIRRNSFIVADMKNRLYYASSKRRKKSRCGRSDNQREKTCIPNSHRKSKQGCNERTANRNSSQRTTKRHSPSVLNTAEKSCQSARRRKRLLDSNSELNSNAHTTGRDASLKTIEESPENSSKVKRKISSIGANKKEQCTKQDDKGQMCTNQSDHQIEPVTSCVRLLNLRALLSPLGVDAEPPDAVLQDVSHPSELPRWSTPMEAMELLPESYTMPTEGTQLSECITPTIEEVSGASTTDLVTQARSPQRVLTPENVVPVSANEGVSVFPVAILETHPVVSLWNNPIPLTSSVHLSTSVSSSKGSSSPPPQWTYGMPGQMQWSCPIPGAYTESAPIPSSSLQTHPFTWSKPTPTESRTDNTDTVMVLPSPQQIPLFINPNPQTSTSNDSSVVTMFTKAKVSIHYQMPNTPSFTNTVKPQINEISEIPKFGQHTSPTSNTISNISMLTKTIPLLNNEMENMSFLSKPTTSMKRKISETLSTIEHLPVKQRVIVSPVFIDPVSSTSKIPEISQTYNPSTETASESMLVSPSVTVTENTPTYVTSPGQSSTVTVMSMINNARSVSSTSSVSIHEHSPKDTQMSNGNNDSSGVDSSINLPLVIKSEKQEDSFFTSSGSARENRIDGVSVSMSNTPIDVVKGYSSNLSIMSMFNGVKSTSSEKKFPEMPPITLEYIEEDCVARSSSGVRVRNLTPPCLLICSDESLGSTSKDTIPPSSVHTQESMSVAAVDSDDNMNVPIGLMLNDLLSTVVEDQVQAQSSALVNDNAPVGHISSVNCLKSPIIASVSELDNQTWTMLDNRVSYSPPAQGSSTVDSMLMEVESDNRPRLPMFNNPVSVISEDNVSIFSTLGQESRSSVTISTSSVTSNNSIPIISGYINSVSRISVRNVSPSSLSVQISIDGDSRSDIALEIDSGTNATMPVMSIFQNNPINTLSAGSVPASSSEQGRVMNNAAVQLVHEPIQVDSNWFLPRPDNSARYAPMRATYHGSAPGLLMISDVQERPGTSVNTSSWVLTSHADTLNTPSCARLGMSIEGEPVSAEDCNQAMMEQDEDEDAAVGLDSREDTPTQEASNVNPPEGVVTSENEKVKERSVWSTTT